MEDSGQFARIKKFFSKYRYPFMILLLGAAMMLYPAPSQSREPKVIQETPAAAPESLAEQLEQILSSIQGAGSVKVLLTEKTGAETSFQSDITSENSEGRAQTVQKTILIEDSGRGEHGLISRIDPPRYQGAVIAAQGADSPRIQLAIVNAVSCVTGLRADQISVVKMK